MRRRNFGIVAIIMSLAAATVMVLTVNGRQVSSVFSNVSSGLNTGGGGMLAEAPQIGAASDAAILRQAPAIASPAGQGAASQYSTLKLSDNLALGMPPGNVERRVDASYTVPHDKFDDAFKALISHGVVDENGYVLSSSTSPDKDGRMVSGTVVLKIPAVNLSEFLSKLPAGTFTASSINFSTIDHSSEFIDDKARLGQAQKELDALQRALAATSDAGTIATLTQQINDAQSNLEKQQAAFSVVVDTVGHATATIHLKEAGAVTVQPVLQSPVLVASAQGGINNDLTILGVVVYVVLTALPIFVLLVIVGSQSRRLVRWGKALVT